MLSAILAVGAGAAAQTIAGFGFALICGPLLIAAFGPSDGLRLIITLSTLVSAAMLVPTWRRAKLREGLLLALPGVLLTPVLVVLLRGVDRNVLTVAAGLTTLISAGALAAGGRISWMHGLPGSLTAGTTSAVMNVLGGMSGPVAALYAVNARWPEDAIKPTLQVFGLTLNAAALMSIGGPALDWRAFVGLLAGWLVGLLIAKRIAAGRIRHVILTLAALSGAFVVWQGVIA
jgi:uncharacterized protein